MDRSTRLRRALLVLLPFLLAVSACAGSGASQVPRTSGSASHSAFPTYVALGDSYSAGSLIPVTDVANGCFRSDHNYPSLVAAALHARLVDRTCSGADTTMLTRSQYPDVPPQQTALDAKTSLVTVGLGGNDGDVFRSLTEVCPRLRASDPTGSPCRAHFDVHGHDALLARLARTRKDLTAVLRLVRQRAPHAHVLAVGYPHIVDARHQCVRLPLATGDYAYAEQVNQALTETVREAARAAGATYVDVWAISAGHDVCATDPWINGSINDQHRAPRYHPFAAEHAAVATLIDSMLGQGG